MAGKLDKFINSIPKELKPGINPILNALLEAWAGADDEIMTQLANTKAQLFIRTAEGSFLDRVASNVGVSRPVALGMLDADFQNLIPNLSFKQKQIPKSFYDTMDVFWGPRFSRANVTSTLGEPFAISPNHTFQVKIDGGETQQVTITRADIRTPGGVTSRELSRVLSRVSGLNVEIIRDPASGELRLNLRTATPGIRGSIELIDGFTEIGFTESRKYRVTDLSQRTVLYQIRPGEVLIELPAIVPTLRRTLKGSHHFHEDATLEPAVAPENGIWLGSFFHARTLNPYVVTKNVTTLLSPILKGSIQNQISVADSSNFPVTGGQLIFDFGKTTQENPVSFLTVSNSNTILIDPSYPFQFTHQTNSPINLLVPNQTTPYVPRINGSDYAIYFTSPSSGRATIQSILESLKAAGIVVNFLILLPTYNYLITNPYDV